MSGEAPRTAWKYRGRKKVPLMKTKPWQKQTSKAAMLERRENSRSGMTGYLASFHSLSRKIAQTTMPKMMRHRTMADVQGC